MHMVKEVEAGKDKDAVLYGRFSDSATWDGEAKTAVSVRDGVLEYYGSELGIEPLDKIFTIYRSPATISNASNNMVGIPLTDEHVRVGSDAVNPVGKVHSAEMIDLFDDATNSRLAIRNKVTVTDAITGALQTGKRELSLGYDAQLVPHNEYDFEQKNIRPHHLAVVMAGRCGSACSFIDKKPIGEDDMQKKKADAPNLNAVFLDAEGQPNLQQIVEIAQQLPEALKTVPMDKLQEIMPMLQEVVAMASPTAEPSEPEMVEDEEFVEEAEVEDMDKEDEEDQIPVTDTAAFKDAVKSAIESHTEVIEKAKDFVDDGYTFKGKSTNQIMRDALAVEHGKTSFEDGTELEVAFKLLKKSASDLSNFGDSVKTKFDELKDKEL